MQNSSSESAAPTGANKALRFILLAFVVASAGAAVYKLAGRSAQTQAAVQTAAPGAAAAAPEQQGAPETKPELKPAAAPQTASKARKTALVYYFYTNTRCSSCKTIEAYTREAVAEKLAAGYKGWAVEFKGVNIDEEPNAHFVQDYWLNSKSVVVQKFLGDKPLKYAKLDKVWQLLGDKKAFVAYIENQTRKLLDEK